MFNEEQEVEWIQANDCHYDTLLRTYTDTDKNKNQ